jgi:hypothetical protein
LIREAVEVVLKTGNHPPLDLLSPTKIFCINAPATFSFLQPIPFPRLPA